MEKVEYNDYYMMIASAANGGMDMGIRVIKTAVAVFFAILIANALELHYALSAGLLAILGVDVTIKRTLKSSTERIAATMIGLLFGSFVFYVFGFSTWVIALFILIYYPLMVKVRLADGIVSSSVLVFHIVSEGTVTFSNILNEIMLLLIGLGIACIVNLLYMPRADRNLSELRLRVEGLFSCIFLHMAEHLREPSTVWDGCELLEAPDAIREGLDLARKAAENKLFQVKDHWRPYFDMRRLHFESIQRMIDLVAQVYQTLPHGESVSDLFVHLSEDVKNEYYTGKSEGELLKLEQHFKTMPLPTTRAEFEMRSALLQLCLELKQYLAISKKMKKPIQVQVKAA